MPCKMTKEKQSAYRQGTAFSPMCHALVLMNALCVHALLRILSSMTGTKNDQVIHFAEQRAAPYSQKGSREKRYTVDNNTGGTHNMLVAIVESGLDIHVCHLGTMG